MAPGLTADETRILNPRPRRHHRRTYSLTEFRIGLAVFALLAAIAGWVAWRGAHPDPALFAGPELTGGAAAPVSAPRGPLPGGLAAASWTEGPVGAYTESNLFEKINGRADFFLARGFRTLTAVTLAHGEATVDIELYDLGSAENALGALVGEKPPEVEAAAEEGGLAYVERNALFVARGPYYARAIGSDESGPVVTQLDHLRGVLTRGLLAGERPWSHVLLVDTLGVPADRVSFQKENAFSFGFARDVHVALLDDETELFVVAAGDPASAAALARRFEQGFLEYGERLEDGGRAWVKDRYLGVVSGAAEAGALVVGVRGAPDPTLAAQWLDRLSRAAAALPPGGRT